MKQARPALVPPRSWFSLIQKGTSGEIHVFHTMKVPVECFVSARSMCRFRDHEASYWFCRLVVPTGAKAPLHSCSRRPHDDAGGSNDLLAHGFSRGWLVSWNESPSRRRKPSAAENARVAPNREPSPVDLDRAAATKLGGKTGWRASRANDPHREVSKPSPRVHEMTAALACRQQKQVGGVVVCARPRAAPPAHGQAMLAMMRRCLAGRTRLVVRFIARVGEVRG